MTRKRAELARIPKIAAPHAASVADWSLEVEATQDKIIHAAKNGSLGGGCTTNLSRAKVFLERWNQVGQGMTLGH